MKSFKFLNNNQIKWKSFGGLYHPLHSLSSGYIMRMISVYEFKFREELPPQDDGRTSQEWYKIFKDELKRRR